MKPVSNPKLNAVTHGITGKTLILCNEDPAQFERHLAAYRDRFKPIDKVEDDLVYELAGIRWRQRRLAATETALFDHAMDEMAPQIAADYKKIDEPTRCALAFKQLADNSNALELLRRYEAHLRRSYDRALANLLALQSGRMPAQPTQKVQNEKMQNEPLPTEPKPPQPPSGPKTLSIVPTQPSQSINGSHIPVIIDSHTAPSVPTESEKEHLD